MPKLFTDKSLEEAIEIWNHSDAWITSVARAALRIKLGTYDFSDEILDEAEKEVLNAIRRKVI